MVPQLVLGHLQPELLQRLQEVVRVTILSL
jgi:hypothetical protein